MTDFALALDMPETARIEITLEDAARSPDGQKVKPFVIAVNRNRGTLESVAAGSARSFHQSDYPGRVVESTLTPEKMRVDVTLEEFPDIWSPPGDWCRFEVDCAREAGGGFVGKWKGTFRGIQGEGAAKAAILPLRERPDWTRPAPGEHPRFLIRRSDIPALKAKMATPWGQAEVERLRKAADGKGGPNTEGATARAVALGLLYHLTGDKSLADKGREILLADVPNWYNVMYVHGAAACVSQGALAYDLLYPSADDAWRRKMQSVFRAKMDYLWFPPVGGFNNKDGSNWSAMFRSALGMAALVILCDAPASPPRIPSGEIVSFPAQEKPAADGEIVAAIIPDRAIGAWLHAGPFFVDSTIDIIGAAGGPSARPIAGTSVSYTTTAGKKATCSFAPLPTNCLISAQKAKGYNRRALEGGVDFATASKRKYLTTHLLSTVLDVKESGVFQWDHSMTKLERLDAWLDGTRIFCDEAVRLDAGQHHLVMEVAIGACGGHEIIESYARFRPLDEKAAATWLAKAKRERAHAEAVAKVDTADKADIKARDWFAVGQQCAEGWVVRALGDNGWNAEGEAYTQHSFRQVLLFSHAVRNAMGRDMAAGRALPAIYPMYVAKTVFGPDGASMPSYGPGGGPLGVDNWARGFGLVEDKYRQVCLAAWDRTQALADTDKFKSIYGLTSELDACSAAFRFVNHPGVPSTQNDPSVVIPKTMVDTEKSGFCFRNGWRGADDSVATVLAEPTEPNQSWEGPDQGDIRWIALGADWAERGIPWGNGVSTRGKDKKTGEYPCMRGLGSIVQVPGYKLEVDRPGPKDRSPRCRLLSSDLTQEGSGVVTMDLSGFYLGVEDEEYKAPDGSTKTRKVGKDVGIKAIRSVAVDHSGSSGAPALMAVADKLTGSPGGETWQFCTLPENKVTFAGQTFTISATNGTTLRGTVVAPTTATITSDFGSFVHEINYKGRHNHAPFKRQVVKVNGAGSFFLVVMTVQRGEAPVVTGDAAKATATVGKRTIRFSDDKLRME